MKRLKHLCLIFLVLTGCGEDKEVRYHKNGQVEFEVPVVDGMWHGEAKGYYEDGSLRGKMTFVKNKRQGDCYEYFPSGKVKQFMQFRDDIQVGKNELFTEEGVLVERSFFDDLGRPKDFHRYNRAGARDYSYFAPITYLSDSSKVGVTNTLWIKIGNADPSRFGAGKLIVLGDTPADTVFTQQSTNDNWFQYQFVPSRSGHQQINSVLVFPGEKPVRVEYGFEVK